MILYLAYFFSTVSNSKAFLYICLIGGFPGLLLLFYDLFSGGVLSLQIRYQLPLSLGLEILVAYIITFHTFHEKPWQKKIGQAMVLTLLIAGLASDTRFFQSDSWWIQPYGKFIIKESQILNKSESPLLVVNISPINLGGILTLSHYLPGINMLPIATGDRLTIPPEYINIFFIKDNSLYPMRNEDGLLRKIEARSS